jgi:succinate dehydrogenase subunit D
MAKSNEPIWWSLFGAGGVVAALLMPITIFLTGIGVYAGWVSERALFDFIHHPLGRIGLFLLISLPLFHAAHRTRFTLIDIGLKSMSSLLAVLLYGGAIVGTVLAIVFLVRL